MEPNHGHTNRREGKSGCRPGCLVALGGFLLVLALPFVYTFVPRRVPNLDPARILGEGATTPTLAVGTSPTAPGSAESSLTALKTLTRQEDLDLLKTAREDTLSRPEIGQSLEEALKLRQHEGRDNALVHYALAAALVPSGPNRYGPYALGQSIIDNGWQSPESDAILPILDALGPALAEARRGAALDYPGALGMAASVDLWIPDFVGSALPRLLSIHGRYLESRDRYAEALDEYFAALTLGRDLGVPGFDLYVFMNGIQVQIDSLRSIRRLVRAGHFDEPTLLRVLTRLREIERSCGTPAEILENDFQARLAQIRGNIEDLVRAKSFEERWNRFWSDVVRVSERRRPHFIEDLQARRSLDRIPADMRLLHKMEKKALAEPLWEHPEQRCDEFTKRIGESQSLVRLAFRHLSFEGYYGTPLLELLLRYASWQNAVRMSQVVVSLEIRKMREGECPETLDALAPEFFPAGLPVNPFTGRPFSYRLDDAGKSYVLSIDEFRVQQNLKVLYDAAASKSAP